MQIQAGLTDEAVLAELGRRLERARLERNLTQQELAREAGLERKAVQRIEGGETVKVVSLIRVLRALGLLEGLDRLVPDTGPSPIELLQLRGAERQRATGTRKRSNANAAKPWRWGDEAA